MLSKITEQIEKLALRTNPKFAIGLLGIIPPSFIRNLQKMRFRQTLKLAARAPFYAEQFKTRGINVDKIRQPSDLGDFFTTGEDLRKYGAKGFIVGRADTAFETTGTTSNEPKSVFFSNKELNQMGRTSALGLYQLGLRREDIVLSAFDVSFWVSPAVVRTAFQYLGCFHVEAGKIPPEDFYERAKFYKPNVIFGEPSWIVRLSEIAEQKGTWAMKFLFAGGENINEETRRKVEKIWNAKFFLNYGQTESFGVIGVECSEKMGYHRNDLNFLFETPVTDSDGFGELVYTTLTREVMPLIRYRSTDVTSLIDEPCQCGLPANRLAKIKGRVDEMVVCGMGNISPWVFAECLRDVPCVSDEWQVRVWHQDFIDTVELRVEIAYADEAHIREAVCDEIRKNLKNRFPDFWKNLKMNLYDFRVIPVARGTLRTARKLQRIIALGEQTAARISVSEIIRLNGSAIHSQNGKSLNGKNIL